MKPKSKDTERLNFILRRADEGKWCDFTNRRDIDDVMRAEKWGEEP